MFTEKLPSIIAKDNTPITIVKILKPITEENYLPFVEEISKQLLSEEEDESKQAEIRQHFLAKSVKDTTIAQGSLFTAPYLTSFHRKLSEKCDGVEIYRIDPEGTQQNVHISHEVKMGIYKKGDGFHVVVTPANFEIDNGPSGLDGAQMLDKKTLEDTLKLVQFTINPSNSAVSFANLLALDSKKSVHLHFNDLEMNKMGFVYNNNGNNLYTCVFDAKEYVSAVHSSFEELKNKFPERVSIISELGKMKTLEDEIRSELLKPHETLDVELIFKTRDLGEFEDRANAGRDSGDAPIYSIQRAMKDYHSSFTRSKEEALTKNPTNSSIERLLPEKLTNLSK